MFKIEEVYAHCDIPCGIYDPHLALVAAHTVIRMTDLTEKAAAELKPDSTPQQRVDIMHRINRYTATKEEHAELCKHEVRIIWGDYFKQEHLKQYTDLHDLVWKIMKTASKARQTVDKSAADELLEDVNRFAEIFWQTKGVQTSRVKAPYPTEHEIVLQK